jgi:hypothetical protein
MSLPDYEKLGAFYLGREYDPPTKQLGADLLYDSRDLTTHAVCIGMTGSGKTGLCLSLLEEAALDGIPAIAIDPKGDIANLALTFPELRAEDFKPWVDGGEASRKGLSIDDFAASTADTWRKGLGEWGQDGARIQRLRDAASVTIYTPGSKSGQPLSILRSLSAPDPATAADATALRERVGSAVAGLLGLLGIDADPLRSREYLLLSTLLDASWRQGKSLDLAAMIHAVQKPPFDQVGVFDLESFYPAKERTELALRINGLLASPGFASWLEGDALDIQELLYDKAGKPRIAIISIAHLNDAERMFVVTLVANELVAWMRRQSGTTSLRALFYMDEVFGFFPPTAMPPSKTPLLTLMKQARAFGIGVVLATQNPVDLDYKGLGNAGTWFIGRLQTERDKQRVIDGLLSSDAASGMDKAQLEALIANLGQRTFLMRNVHDDAPVLLRTRWALSYLRGPLTLAEIGKLKAAQEALTPPRPAPESASLGTATVAPATSAVESAASSPDSTPAPTPAPATGMSNRSSTGPSGSRPLAQAGVVEKFLPAVPGAAVHYQPRLGATVRAHFVDTKAGMDAWETWYYLAPLAATGPEWPAADVFEAGSLQFADAPVDGATFEAVPGAALAAARHKVWAKQLADHVYRNAALEVFRCPALKLTAAPGGSESEFRARVAQVLREKRDDAVVALRRKYAKRLVTLEERQRRAGQKLAREKDQASNQTMSSALSVGGSLLGALFGGGRRSSVLTKASTAARSVGRIGKERSDVTHAEAELTALHEQYAALSEEVETAVRALESEFDPAAIRIEVVPVKPRKSDTTVEEVALVWQPA